MGNADHLGMSIQLLLNIWNILIRVMQILGGNRDWVRKKGNSYDLNTLIFLINIVVLVA